MDAGQPMAGGTSVPPVGVPLGEGAARIRTSRRPAPTSPRRARPYVAIGSTGLDPHNGPGPLDIGTFKNISGTSMATPHIVGIVAQLLQVAPDATPAQIENAFKSTAVKFSDGARYETVGQYTTSVDKEPALLMRTPPH